MGVVVRVRRSAQARRARGTALRLLRAVGDIPVAVALLFAFSLATPQAALVYHHHAGGERAHVHADVALLALLGLADAAPQRPAGTPDHRPAFARDTGAVGGHVHQQQRYHSAVVATATFVAFSAPLTLVPPAVGRCVPRRAAGTATARAPPRSLLG